MTMFAMNATMPAWEQSIRAHTALSVLSLKTGSVHSLHAFEVAQVTASLLNEEAPVPDNVKQELTKLNNGSVQNVQTQTGSYTEKIQDLKNTTPNPEAWKEKILNANKITIQNFADKINAAGEEAINTIQDLPPAQQNGAANVYSGGLHIVNTVVNKASEAIGTVINSIKDFLSGIWNKITDVYNDVKDWCSGALDTLGSLFGFFSVFSLAAAQGGANTLEAMPSFTGFVGWNLAIGMGQARTSFDTILENLERDAYIIVVSQQLGVEDVPQHGLCLVGRVQFGSKFAAGQGSGLDLSGVWDTTMKYAEKKGLLSATPLAITQEAWQGILGGGSDQNTTSRGPTTATPGSNAGRSTFPRKFGRAGLASNGLMDQPIVGA